MDKQEYKILLEEIQTLIANEEFAKAADLADKIDWRKVRSFATLKQISDLYKINRRFDEALEILLMAYDRNPNSRNIVFSLCELYIDTEDLVSALQYLALYKKMSPSDTDVYILQYKILELEDASIEDKIELLEEYCRKDYHKEWAYQLAYLYHRIGLATKCVETCDQLITWFGDGPFVIKAMELKMLHARLTPEQQNIYDAKDAIEEEIEAYESDEYIAEKPEPGLMPELGEDEDFHVKTIDMGKFNTINLQKALAESMRELMGEEYDKDSNTSESITNTIMKPMMDTDPLLDTDAILAGEESFESEELAEDDYNDNYEATQYGEEEYTDEEYSEEYSDEYVDEYSEDEYDDDYSGEYSEEYEEDYSDEEYDDEYDEEYTEEEYTDEYVDEYSDDEGEYEDEYSEDEYQEESVKEEYATDETGFIGNVNPVDPSVAAKIIDIANKSEQANNSVVKKVSVGTGSIPKVATDAANLTEDAAIALAAATIDAAVHSTGKIPAAFNTGKITIDGDKGDKLISNEPKTAKRPEAFDKILEDNGNVKKTVKEPIKPVRPIKIEKSAYDDVTSMENDGQISFAFPQEKVVEKQITGQLKLDEVLMEWENTKRNMEMQHQQDIKNKILNETGKIFQNYDESNKNSILNQLEREEKANKKILKNDLELHKVDDLETISSVPETVPDNEQNNDKRGFSATEALNKSFNSTIWDEVDAAIAAEANNAVETAEAVVAGGVAEAAADAKALEVAGDLAGEVVSAAAEVVSDIVTDNNNDNDEANGVDDIEDSSEEYADEYSDDYAEEYEDEYVDEYNGELDDDYDYDGEYYEEEYTDEYSDEYEGEYIDEYSEEYADEYEDDYAEDSELVDTAQINEIGDALIADADKALVETVEEANDQEAEDNSHGLSVTEKELFEDFLYSKKMSKQILEAVDKISLAAFVGNVIITGDSSKDTVELAKKMIKEIQLTDSNFISSKVAKISGYKMNKKDIADMLTKLGNGALIIEKAGDMKKETMENVTKVLENLQEGIIIILTGKKKEIDHLIDIYGVLTGYFNARIDIMPMNDKALVEYAKKYAYSREYRIDEEKAVLALHQRINALQIGEHIVTTKEVENIVEDAIEHSKRAKISAFFSIVSGKRYDYEDMIILKEKDFEY